MRSGKKTLIAVILFVCALIGCNGRKVLDEREISISENDTLQNNDQEQGIRENTIFKELQVGETTVNSLKNVLNNKLLDYKEDGDIIATTTIDDFWSYDCTYTFYIDKNDVLDRTLICVAFKDNTQAKKCEEAIISELNKMKLENYDFYITNEKLQPVDSMMLNLYQVGTVNAGKMMEVIGLGRCDVTDEIVNNRYFSEDYSEMLVLNWCACDITEFWIDDMLISSVGIEQDEAALIAYRGEEQTICVPKEIGGYKITEISCKETDKYNPVKVTSIELPNTVTGIEDLRQFPNLKTVVVDIGSVVDQVLLTRGEPTDMWDEQNVYSAKVFEKTNALLLEEVHYLDDGQTIRSSESYEYYDSGMVKKNISIDDWLTIVSEYDESGNVIRVERCCPDETNRDILKIEEYEYTDYIYVYNIAGQVVEQKEIHNGEEISRNCFEYDKEGNLIEEQYWVEGQFHDSKKYEYNKNGRLLKLEECIYDGTVDSIEFYDYTENGALLRVQRYDSDGGLLYTECYEYNDNGILIKRQDHDYYYSKRYGGMVYSCFSEYDERGNLIMYYDERTDVTDYYEYDKNNNLIMKKSYGSDEGYSEEKYEYDSEETGNLCRKTVSVFLKDENDRFVSVQKTEVKYKYDAFGNVVEEEYEDGSLYKYQYKYETAFLGVNGRDFILNQKSN